MAGSALVVGGSFLPWVISGEARRDSYATIRVAQRLGVVGMPVWEAVLSVWFCTPLLAVSLCVAVVFRRRGAAALVGVPLALISGLVAGVVRWAPVPQGIGPAVALAGSLVVAGGLVLSIGTGRAQLPPPPDR